MLLLIGLHTAARVVATSQRTCPHCHHHALHEVIESARKLTLFFIPVCRVGAARYVDACAVCGWETELTEAQARSANHDTPPLGPQDAPAWSPQDR